MGYWKSSLISFALIGACFCEEEIGRNHILYLTRQEKIPEAIDAYFKLKTKNQKHDSEILSQIAEIILERNMHSRVEEKELLTLYGASIAGTKSLLDFCEIGAKSPHPKTQLVSIQLAGQIPDDGVDPILCKAFSSNYFLIRMEAASYMAMRKYKYSVGYIESLMTKIHPVYHYFFSQMFAQIGTPEAMIILKKMIHSGELFTRIAATLAAADARRDDLLKDIRAAATHLNPAEQEACAFALGLLGDSSSCELLEKLSLSFENEVALSAARSLAILGKKEFIKNIVKKAEANDLFAISMLGSMDGMQDLLHNLCKEKDKQLRFNAFFSLLLSKDLRAIKEAPQFLISDYHDLAFIPTYSTGRTMMYWKALPSLSVLSKSEQGEGLLAISLAIREQILTHCFDLDQNEFLLLADYIIKKEQKDLIPLLMELLCNIKSEKVIDFLKNKAEELGKPFTRYYACLALAKMKVQGPYFERIKSWILDEKKRVLIEFNPVTSKTMTDTSFNYKLTPKENSSLLIESLMMLCSFQEEKSLDLLLDIIKNGNPKNHPILAGLLIKALE